MPPHRPRALAPFLGKLTRNLSFNRPWKGETLKTLPVYKDLNPTDEAGYVTKDRDALEAQVREVAARLGITGELMAVRGQGQAVDHLAGCLRPQRKGGGLSHPSGPTTSRRSGGISRRDAHVGRQLQHLSGASGMPQPTGQEQTGDGRGPSPAFNGRLAL